MAFELREENLLLNKKHDLVVDDKVVCDLDFEYHTDNGILAFFAPDLKHSLYCKASDAQGELVEDADHVTALRYPAVKSLKWEGTQIIGGELTFHVGVSGKANVVFSGVEVKKWKIEPLEGGAVILGFRVRVKPNEAQAGKLSRFLEDGEVQVSLIPPAA